MLVWATKLFYNNKVINKAPNNLFNFKLGYRLSLHFTCAATWPQSVNKQALSFNFCLFFSLSRWRATVWEYLLKCTLVSTATEFQSAYRWEGELHGIDFNPHSGERHRVRLGSECTVGPDDLHIGVVWAETDHIIHFSSVIQIQQPMHKSIT